MSKEDNNTIDNFDGLAFAMDSGKSFEEIVKGIVESRSYIINCYMKAWLASNIPEKSWKFWKSQSKWVVDNCELVIQDKGNGETVYFMRIKK